jgi:hypothetical protein
LSCAKVAVLNARLYDRTQIQHDLLHVSAVLTGSTDSNLSFVQIVTKVEAVLLLL